MSMYPGYPNYMNYGNNCCPQTPPAPCIVPMPVPAAAPYIIQQCPSPIPAAASPCCPPPTSCPPTNSSMNSCTIGFDQYLNAMSQNNLLQMQNASLSNELNHYVNDRSQNRNGGSSGNTREKELEIELKKVQEENGKYKKEFQEIEASGGGKANAEKNKKLVDEMSALEWQLETATDEGQRESISKKITTIEEQIETTSGGNAGVKKFKEKIERLERELAESGGGKANAEKSKKIITEITELEGQLSSATDEGKKEGIRKKITTLAEQLVSVSGGSASSSGGNAAVKKFFSMFQRLESELKKASQMSSDEGVKKLLNAEQEKNKKLAAATDALKTAVLKCETVPNINQVKADINNKKYDANLEEKSSDSDKKY